MKKKLTVIGLLLFITFSGFCKGLLELTVSPFVGLSDCKMDELLYNMEGSVRSLLEWEQATIFDLGFKLDARFNRYDFALSFSYSIPCKNGQMTDSDWEDGSKYSITNHPVIKFKNIDSWLDFSYMLYEDQVFTFAPVIQLEYFYTAFNAGKGSGIRYNNPVNVYGVDYSRHSVFSFLGIRSKLNITPLIFLGADLLFSPFCYQNSFDYHHGQVHPFNSNDIQTGFFSKYKFSLSGGINISPKISLELQFSSIFGGPDKGKLITDYYNGTMLQADEKSGARILYKSCTFFINFNL